MINKIDDGSASLNFGDFCLLMSEKTVEVDPETLFKDTFRVFSKDEDGEDQTGVRHCLHSNKKRDNVPFIFFSKHSYKWSQLGLAVFYQNACRS